jgi:hypothetical protein
MLLPGNYNIFGGLLKAGEVNHFLAQEFLPIFVQARSPAPTIDNAFGGNDNFFWNRGFWSTSADTETYSQASVQGERC